MKKLFILLLSFFSLYSFAGFVDLTPEEMAIIERGDYIKKVSYPNDKNWPEVNMILLVKGSSKKNKAIFCDYPNQPKFIPGLISAEVVNQISPLEADVKFEMKMPWPVPNSHYTSKHIIQDLGDDNYFLTWDLIEANQMKAAKGSIYFIPHGENTIFSYTSFIIPDSSFAGLFKKRVEKEVVNSVLAISNYLSKK